MYGMKRAEGRKGRVERAEGRKGWLKRAEGCKISGAGRSAPLFWSTWNTVYIYTVSSTYANILKYHIQGMLTNIILQVFI